MKLKDILSESSLKVLDRKFGEPLPTLEDTTKAYKLKQEDLNEIEDEGDFIKAIQGIQAGLDEAEYGFNDLARLRGMSSSEKRIVKTLFSRFKVLMKGVEKARRVIRNESINEATKQEVNALKKFIKDFDKMQKQYWNISKIGDKELRNPKYNKHYETILKAQKSIVKLAREIQEKERVGEGLNEGRYHDWRNDESLTPKQKIGKSMREIRDALNELDKTVKMNLKLKTELKMKSEDYWKNTHKALTKISERLVKMANKVGNLK